MIAEYSWQARQMFNDKLLSNSNRASTVHGTLLSKIVKTWLHVMRLTAAILPVMQVLVFYGAARIKPTPLSHVNTTESQTTIDITKI